MTWFARAAAFLGYRRPSEVRVRDAILLVVGASPASGGALMRAMAASLRQRHNIVALLFDTDDALRADLEESCHAVLGPLATTPYGEVSQAVAALLTTQCIDYAIVADAGAGAIIRALIDAFIPVVTVKTAFDAGAPIDLAEIDVLDWSVTVIFTDAGSAEAASLAHPPLAGRQLHVVPYPAAELAALSAAQPLTARSAAHVEDFARRLDDIGREAVEAMRQRSRDFATLKDSPIFDAAVFLPPQTTLATREEAIVAFLARWNAVGRNCRSGNFFLRRPCAGFHPQIYAHEHADRYDTATINPLAHAIRSGFPEGPWRHDVIVPDPAKPWPAPPSLRIAVHAHFYYPELAADFLQRLSLNRLRGDLFLTTDTEAKAEMLRTAVRAYPHGRVTVRLVPNRGRDWGAFLTGVLGEIEPDYDIVGHFHGKRSPHSAVGDPWREFLWQSLLGPRYPAGDIIVGRFAADEGLGLVFADDPHLPDWDGNLDVASQLARRMGIDAALPPYIDFPVGSMFWARVAALRPLCALGLDWDDYPQEPAPIDGSLLNAVERLLPLVIAKAGYRFATIAITGVTWDGAIGTDHDATCDRTRRDRPATAD